MSSEIHLGERLKNARSSVGMLQKDMAKLLGVTVSTISDYENERVRIPGNKLDAFASACGMTIDELMGTKKARPLSAEAARALLPTLYKEVIDLLDKLTPDGQDHVREYLQLITKSNAAFLKPQPGQSDRDEQDNG